MLTYASFRLTPDAKRVVTFLRSKPKSQRRSARRSRRAPGIQLEKSSPEDLEASVDEIHPLAELAVRLIRAVGDNRLAQGLHGYGKQMKAAAGNRGRACLAVGILWSAAAAAEPCAHEQVCGLKNAEDLVRVPGSHWAIASRLAKDPQAPGGFSLVDLEKLTSQVLTPDVSRPAAAEYSACPGAPVAAQLVTHGLDLRQKAGGTAAELFAVHHGSRESIEVFDLHASKQGVNLTWKGCVVLPAQMSANAVAALPDGIAVTSFGSPGDKGDAELLAGRPSGFVGRWTRAKGWSHVAGSEFGGDNGIAASADGSLLYVNDWADGTLRVLSLQGGAAPATIKLGDFHPDNVHFMPDGNLLVAGQVGTGREVMACVTGPGCSVGSAIAVVDPKSHQVRLQWSVAPTASFGAASTALLYGHDYWVSSFRGDRIVRLGPAPGQ